MSQTEKQLVNCRYSKADLEGKRVIYAFAPKEDVVAAGHGHLIVEGFGDDAMMIDIEVDQHTTDPGQFVLRRWTLTQRQADALRPCADRKVADFEMYSAE